MATLKKNHDEQGGYKVTIVAAVLILMQFLMVYGRYYSRRLQKVSFQADDYTLVLAMAGIRVGRRWKVELTNDRFSQRHCVRLVLLVGLPPLSSFEARTDRRSRQAVGLCERSRCDDRSSAS